MSPAAAASMVWPEGAELLTDDSTCTSNGRGKSGLSSFAAANATAANTASWPSSHQRLRAAATSMAAAPNARLTPMTSPDLRLPKLSHAGIVSAKFMMARSS